MEQELNITYAEGQKDIDLFWERQERYFLTDIMPNVNLGDPLTEEDVEWFLSQEYKDCIMKLYYRVTDPLSIAFFNLGKETIGFAVYVIYHPEDHKCFITDYCIFPSYRNKGLGKSSFAVLEKELVQKGATYIDLNVSNTRNRRFWESNGFFKTDLSDDRNNFIYRKILKNNSV